MTWESPAGDGGTAIGSWTFIVASAAGCFTFPQIPVQLSAWAPPPTAHLHIQAIVAVDGGPFVDYPAARALLQSFLPMLPYAAPSTIPLLPADGTMRMTVYSDSPF